MRIPTRTDSVHLFARMRLIGGGGSALQQYPWLTLLWLMLFATSLYSYGGD